MYYDNKGTMNQKGIVPIIIVLLVVVATSIVAVGVWKSDLLSNLKVPWEKPEETIGPNRPPESPIGQPTSDSQAVLIVKTFCDNFFKGPPAINEQGVMLAFNLLSQKARQSMSVIGPSPSAALASFAGIQDVPDQGYTIDNIAETTQKATIKTTWKYSSGPVSKTFDLEKENGNWKINSIY